MPLGSVSDIANRPGAPPVLLKVSVYTVYWQFALELRPLDQVVAQLAEDDERGPPLTGVGHAPPPGAETDGMPMVLVTLNAASLVSLTSSLSAAEVLGAVYSAAVPGVAVMVALSKSPLLLVAVPGIV